VLFDWVVKGDEDDGGFCVLHHLVGLLVLVSRRGERGGGSHFAVRGDDGIMGKVMMMMMMMMMMMVVMVMVMIPHSVIIRLDNLQYL